MTSAGGIAGCVPLVSPLIHGSSSQRSGTHLHVSAQWYRAVRFFGLSTDVNTPACHVPPRDANGRRLDRTCGGSSRLLFRLAELEQEPNPPLGLVEDLLQEVPGGGISSAVANLDGFALLLRHMPVVREQPPDHVR